MRHYLLMSCAVCALLAPARTIRADTGTVSQACNVACWGLSAKSEWNAMSNEQKLQRIRNSGIQYAPVFVHPHMRWEVPIYVDPNDYAPNPMMFQLWWYWNTYFSVPGYLPFTLPGCHSPNCPYAHRNIEQYPFPGQ